MASTREKGFVNQVISLDFQLKNLETNVNLEPFSISKVEIYNTKAKAKAGVTTDILDTITTITTNGTGLLSYIVPVRTSPNIYFDKLFVTPISGGEEIKIINSFLVLNELFGGTPTKGKEKARIFLNLCDITADPKVGTKVQVILCNNFSIFGNNLIKREPEEFISDTNGVIEMFLLETTTMSTDTGEAVSYELSALNGSFTRQFTVPKGTLDENFFDLPKV